MSTNLPNKPPPGGYSHVFPLGSVLDQSPTARKRARILARVRARMAKAYTKKTK